MSIVINEVDRVKILTLQDNYIDLLSGDSTDVVKRAMPVKGAEIKNSSLGEHGFSAIVTVFQREEQQRVIFCFGFSEHGTADSLRGQVKPAPI